MPRINLLPWREELRQKRKKDFTLALVGALLIGGLLAYSYKMFVQFQINNQTARNELLREEIAALDRKIEEILSLESQRDRLLARMDIIDRLQRSRPEAVHLFDELVNNVPEGTFLTAMRQTNDRIELNGTAQSSTRVSAFLRNIENSQWLRQPGLEIISTVDQGPARNAQFRLFAEQVPMGNEEEQF